MEQMCRWFYQRQSVTNPRKLTSIGERRLFGISSYTIVIQLCDLHHLRHSIIAVCLYTH